MSACTDACDHAYDPVCADRCRAMENKIQRALCWAACAEEYAACLAACAAEAAAESLEGGARRVADAFAQATRWLRAHPDAVAGTIIVVADVAFVVTSGASAPALILVAA